MTSKRALTHYRDSQGQAATDAVKNIGVDTCLNVFVNGVHSGYIFKHQPK